MKKVLLVFDATNFSEGAFEYARRLNETKPILLTGVFLPMNNYASLWSYASALPGVHTIPLMEADDSYEVYRNIERFERLCRINQITFRIHKDFTDFAVTQLARETRFADLLVVSSEKFYSNLSGDSADAYLQDALNESECPVIVVPESYAFPSKNILSYDGTESSVYAIKQYAYLFPEYCSNETVLVYASVNHSAAIPEQGKMEELATQHFSDLDVFKLEFRPEKYFSVWLRDNQGAIVVCGSFGRSFTSQFLKRSFISEVIAEHKLPVFIAHKYS